MKRLIAVLAAVTVMSSIASAELLKNFKYDGSLEVNAYNVDNATDFDSDTDDKNGKVDTRLILNMGFDLNDDANAVVTLTKNDRQWGTGSQNGDNIQTNVWVDQAYLNLKGVMGLDHRVGRQFYGNPGDLVIYYGPKMWPYQTNIGAISAIDAWVGSYKYNDWEFTALLGKDVNAAGNMGENLSAFDVKTKLSGFDLNAYYYYKSNNNTADSHLGLIGLRAGYDMSKFVNGLSLSGEYDANNGSNNTTNKDYKGSAYKLNANYSMSLAGKLGLKAEYAYLSGQDTSSDNKVFTPINGDYRPGIIANGYGTSAAYLGAVGTGNKVLSLGANWTPSAIEKLNIAVDYVNLKVAEENAGMNDTIGNECDLTLTWTHSDKLSLKGYYAFLSPDEDNAKAILGKDDAETMLGAAFVVKF
ncbi:MAG: hypothetical protein KA059_09355 [Elusimicrobiales bacterium]|nr:hypothetical protein [Elusimicrobiales bacterium]